MIRKIVLNKGTDKMTWLRWSNAMQRRDQLCENGTTEEGRYYLTCKFENEMQLAAFLCVLGGAREAVKL